MGAVISVFETAIKPLKQQRIERKLKAAFVFFRVLITIYPICNTEMFIVVRVKSPITPSTDTNVITIRAFPFVFEQYFLLWGYN